MGSQAAQQVPPAKLGSPAEQARSLKAEATAKDLLVPRSNLRHVWRWPRILRILHTWPEFW